MLDRRYFFFDIDGTIAYNDCPPTEKTAALIQQLREHGHMLFIATARSISDIYPSITDLGFDGIISSAGSQVNILEKVLYCKNLSKKLVGKILAAAKKRNISIVLEGSEGIYLVAGKKAFPRQWTYPVINNIVRFSNIVPVQKFSLHISPGQDVDEFLSHYLMDFDIYPNANGTFYECIRHGYGKDYGLKWIMKYYKADLALSVVFGDSMNDYEMIKNSGLGIVMGNAPKELLDIADYVTTTVYEEGVAAALCSLGLV